MFSLLWLSECSQRPGRTSSGPSTSTRRAPRVVRSYVRFEASPTSTTNATTTGPIYKDDVWTAPAEGFECEGVTLGDPGPYPSGHHHRRAR